MSLFSLIILTLNIVFNYFSTREDLHKESEENLMLMAKQIAVSIEQSRSVYEYIVNDSKDKVSQDVIDGLFTKASPTNIINELIESDKNLLEITVIKAYSWKTTPQILFGTYNFKDVGEDISSSQQVMKQAKAPSKIHTSTISMCLLAMYLLNLVNPPRLLLKLYQTIIQYPLELLR
jgi:hypothetical protein